MEPCYNYKSLWKYERKIYDLLDVEMPFPIEFKQFGVYAISVLIMFVLDTIGVTWLLSQIPLISLVFTNSFLMNYILIPVAITFYVTRASLDGKAPHKFFYSLIRYHMSPKKYNRYEPVNKIEKTYTFNGKIGYRRKQVE